jgi:hypothetical protein
MNWNFREFDRFRHNYDRAGGRLIPFFPLLPLFSLDKLDNTGRRGLYRDKGVSAGIKGFMSGLTYVSDRLPQKRSWVRPFTAGRTWSAGNMALTIIFSSLIQEWIQRFSQKVPSVLERITVFAILVQAIDLLKDLFVQEFSDFLSTFSYWNT